METKRSRNAGATVIWPFTIDIMIDLVKLRTVAGIFGAIIGHIQIQRAIAINVRQRHCHRTVFAQRAGIFAAFHKSPVPLVRETQHARSPSC